MYNVPTPPPSQGKFSLVACCWGNSWLSGVVHVFLVLDSKHSKSPECLTMLISGDHQTPFKALESCIHVSNTANVTGENSCQTCIQCNPVVNSSMPWLRHKSKYQCSLIDIELECVCMTGTCIYSSTFFSVLGNMQGQQISVIKNGKYFVLSWHASLKVWLQEPGPKTHCIM